MKGKKVKTNRQLNQEHDAKKQAQIRPKIKEWNFEPLQEAINKMIRMRNEQA